MQPMVCPPITITFLGTGTSTGVPMVACTCDVCRSDDPRDKRLRSSILVQSSQTCFVIDTTPDFRYQMLRQQVRQLDAVLYTHPHKDHVAGLDDVKAFCFFGGKPMDVYANEITEKALRREFMYAFEEHKYPGVPEILVHPIDLDTFLIGDIPVTPILVWHLHMPVLGFRMGNFTYITDANRIDPSEQEKIRGSRIMVLNALRHKKHLSHFSLSEAIGMVDSLEVPAAYFTHISHQLGMYTDVSAGLPPHIHLAYDGLQLQLE